MRDDPDACWIWARATTRGGYGVLWVKELRAYWKSHRLAYHLKNGEILKGVHVLHSCDVPACCNPRHLSAGDDAMNRADSIRKKRHARCETHGRRKLSREDVAAIVASTGVTQRALARRYGVSESAVSMIVNGKRWRDL